MSATTTAPAEGTNPPGATGSVDQWATSVVRLCRDADFVPDVSLTAAVHHYIPRPKPAVPSLSPESTPAVGKVTPHGVVQGVVSGSVAPQAATASASVAAGTVITSTINNTINNAINDDHHDNRSTAATTATTTGDAIASVVQGKAVKPPATLVLPEALMRGAYRLQIPCCTQHAASTMTKAGAAAAGPAYTEPPVSPASDVVRRERASQNCKASPHCFYGLQTLRSDPQTLRRCVEFLVGPCPALLPATRAKDGSAADTTEAQTAEAAEAACKITAANACLWRGLRNLGNTCYFNSIVQLLFSLAAVRRAILSEGAQNTSTTATTTVTATPNKTGAVAAAAESPNTVSLIDLEAVSELSQSGLKEVFTQMAFLRGDVDRGVDPSSFVQYLALDPAVQQDAQEFLALLIDWLRCSCGPAVKSVVDATLGGTFLYDRRCGACGRSVKRAEPFLSLSVPVRATLEDSLTSFLTPEQVEDVACEECGKKATATSYQYLRTLPDVLLIHLNRFEFDMQSLQRRKVNTSVRFPTVLDLTPYERQWHEARQQASASLQQPQLSSSSNNTTPTAGAGAGVGAGGVPHTTTATAQRSQLFELEGVLNHLGDSAHSGHYTFQGKVPTTNDKGARTAVWLDFNDATVSPLKSFTGPTGSSPDAYILVYRRVAPDATPTPTTTTTDNSSGSSFDKTQRSSDRLAASAPDMDGTASPPLMQRCARADSSSMPGHDANSDGDAHGAPRMVNPASFDPAAAAAATPNGKQRVSATTTTTAGAADDDLAAPPSAAEFPGYLLDYVARANWACTERRRLWKARREHVSQMMAAWSKAVDTVMNTSPAASSTSSASPAGTRGKAGDEALYAVPTDWLEAFGRALLPSYVNVRALNESPATADFNQSPGTTTTPAALPALAVPAMWQPISPTAAFPGGTTLAATSSAAPLPAAGVVATPAIVPSGPHYRAAEEASRAVLASHDPKDNLIRREVLGFPLDFTEVPFTFCCTHGMIAPWAPFKVLNKTALVALHAFLLATGAVDTPPVAATAAAGEKTTPLDAVNRSRAGGPSVAATADDFLRTMAPFRLSPQTTCSLCAAAMAAKVEQLAQNSRSDVQALEMLHDRGCSLGDDPTVATAPTESALAPTTTTTNTTTNTTTTPSNSTTEADRPTTGDATASAPPPSPPEEVYVYVSDDLTLAWETYVEGKNRWQKSIARTEGFTAVFTLLRCGEQPAWGQSHGSGGGAHVVSAFSNVTPLDASSGGDANPDLADSAQSPTDEAPSPLLPAVGSSVPSAMSNPIHGLIEALAPSADSYGADGEMSGVPEVSQQLLCPHGSIRPEATVRVVPERLRQYWLRRLPSILTAENQRGGLILSPNPAWTIDSAKVEKYLLPFLPVTNMKQRCPLCVVESVRLTTDRHARRLQQVAESKRFPTLWHAGHFTSPSALAQLRAGLGAEVPENTTDEQLMQSHHPNRGFFKRPAEKAYRDFVKQWSAHLTAEVAAKEAEVRRLRPAAQKEQERDRLFAARVTTRGGGGRGRGGGGSKPGSPAAAKASPAAPDAANPSPQLANPESAVAKLAAAEAALAALQESLATASPAFTEYYGCLPTWWVARWFVAVREATQFVQDGVAEEHDRIARMQSGISTTAIRERREAAHNKSTISSRGGVPPLTYDGWLCPHGGALLELSWLNPADPFWAGRRGKSAELLWHPEWVAHRQTTNLSYTVHADTAAAATSAEASLNPSTNGGAPGSPPPPAALGLDPAVDCRTACWLPPMLIVPMAEFMAVLQAYGDADMIGAVAQLTGVEALMPEQSSSDYAPLPLSPEATTTAGSASRAPLPLLVVEEKGVRRLQPVPCADKCGDALLAEFEENRSYFTRGSLKLTLHIRKSKKNFYDATATLTSPPPSQVVAHDGSDGGIHHYTTLRQLRHILSEYILREHGYLVAPEALEIARSRTKPLKRAQPPIPHGAMTKPPSVTSLVSPNSDAVTSPLLAPDEATATTADSKNSGGSSGAGGGEAGNENLEDCTLFELGIHDGGSLFVQLTEQVATACASTVNHVGQEEVWQTIPPELLDQLATGGGGGAGDIGTATNTAGSGAAAAAGGGGGGRSAAAVALAEAERRAFTETRLGGDPKHASPTPAGASPADAAEDVGVACPVCTFVNAPGMVCCEMCESPLPH